MTLLSELHAAVVEGNAKKVAELCAQHREHSSTPPSAACWEALNETMTSVSASGVLPKCANATVPHVAPTMTTTVLHVTQQASDGTTPLIQAATAGNVAMVQTLLAAGARADVQAQVPTQPWLFDYDDVTTTQQQFTMKHCARYTSGWLHCRHGRCLWAPRLCQRLPCRTIVSKQGS